MLAADVLRRNQAAQHLQEWQPTRDRAQQEIDSLTRHRKNVVDRITYLGQIKEGGDPVAWGKKVFGSADD